MNNIMKQNQLIENLKSISLQERKNLFDELEKHAYANNLEIGGQKLPFIKIPFILDKELIEHSLIKFDSLTEALISLEKYALSSEGKEVFERLMNSLTEGGRELVNQCSYESDFSLKRRHRRFDSYIDPVARTASVIEVNQAAPLAISYYDTVQQVADITLSKAGFSSKKHNITEAMLEWFIAEYQERFPKKFPKTVALVIEHGYAPKFTDLPTMAQRIMEKAKEKYHQEIEVLTCFPYDIRLQNDTPYFGNIPIDMIWRNSVYMTQYKEDGEYLDDYLTICNNPEKYLLINATRVWLTRNKETFALLSNTRLQETLGLSEQQKRDLAEIIPYSVNGFYEKEVLVEIIENREEWITKPSDAGFGKGVEFGSNHSLDSWKAIVEKRSTEFGYIFQKRVSYPKAEVWDIDEDGSLITHHIEFDICPHHINGAFTGTVLSRANIISDDPQINKMNLVSGGYLLPIIVA